MHTPHDVVQGIFDDERERSEGDDPALQGHSQTRGGRVDNGIGWVGGVGKAAHRRMHWPNKLASGVEKVS